MYNCVDDGLKQGLSAILWQIYSRRSLSRCNLHISDGESQRLYDLAIQRSGDVLTIRLT